MGIPNQMTYIERIRSMFQPKSADERIADAIDAAVVEITYICADDQSERITTAVHVLAATLISDVSADGREQALHLALKQAARILGVRSPTGDAEPSADIIDLKRPA